MTNQILRNEYALISYSHTSNAILLKWLLQNSYMSEWEFNEIIDNLFSSIEVFNTANVYIDAWDFCFPILDRSVKLIKNYISECSTKELGIVMSSTLLGKNSLALLSRKLEPTIIELTIFHSREEGERWQSSKELSTPLNLL